MNLLQFDSLFVEEARGRLLCGYVAMWLCGSVAMLLCTYVAIWLCGYVAMWLCGYVSIFGQSNRYHQSTYRFPPLHPISAPDA